MCKLHAAEVFTVAQTSLTSLRRCDFVRRHAPFVSSFLWKKTTTAITISNTSPKKLENRNKEEKNHPATTFLFRQVKVEDRQQEKGAEPREALFSLLACCSWGCQRGTPDPTRHGLGYQRERQTKHPSKNKKSSHSESVGSLPPLHHHQPTLGQPSRTSTSCTASVPIGMRACSPFFLSLLYSPALSRSAIALTCAN